MNMARRAYASLKEVWGAHRIARRPCEAASAISMQNDSRGSGCYSKIIDRSIVARAGGQASAESAARIASWSVRHARAANRRRSRLRAWRAAATPVAEEKAAPTGGWSAPAAAVVGARKPWKRCEQTSECAVCNGRRKKVALAAGCGRADALLQKHLEPVACGESRRASSRSSIRDDRWDVMADWPNSANTGRLCTKTGSIVVIARVHGRLRHEFVGARRVSASQHLAPRPLRAKASPRNVPVL